MAVERFDWRWLNFLADIGVIAFIYGLFGVFVIVPGRGLAKNLEEAKRLIARNQNIVIYPEGGIVTDHIIGKFKPGAAALSTEVGVPVLPISLRLNGCNFLRRKLTVNIGEPMDVSADANQVETTNRFYDAMNNLFDRV
jgi:1-acyl-sn-glycerol-3-phosphate acyltransferase